MRARIGLGVLAPSLAQMWTTFKSWGDEHSEDQDPQCSKWYSNWDGYDAKSLTKNPTPSKYFDQEEYSKALRRKQSKATRHVILIRHGQYEIKGKTDDLRYLTEKGRQQARATGRRLKELRAAGLLPFNVMTNSTLKRAIETADLIFDELKGEHSPIVRKSDEILCEGAPCPPEPPIDYWNPTLTQFIEDGARLESAFRRYIHRAPPDQEKDSFEVLVCHANVIRYFVCRTLQFPARGWLRMGVYHGSITWLCIFPDGRVTLRVLGDMGHFPTELLTA